MGTLRSDFNHSGMDVGGLTLGEPARDVDKNNEPVGKYRWDDSRLPNGVIEDDGIIMIDKVEGI